MSAHRSIPAALAALALAAGSLVFVCAPAFAGYSFVGSFGSAGSGGGQFSGPARLVVEAATGDVLVLDEGNRRVEKFGPLGEYLLELNGAGAPVLFSEADELSGLAVDNSGGASGGDVYVATGNSNSNAGSTFVDRFRPGGGGYEYACRLSGPGGGCNPPGAIASEKFDYAQASVAVGPGGEVYALQGGFGEAPKDVVEFDAAGEYVASLKGPLLSSGFGFNIAVDPTGRVLYVVNIESEVVKLTLNAAGDAVESETAFDTTGEPYAVAVEPTTGDVFVVDHTGGTHVSVYNPGGELLEEFGKGVTGGIGIGIAYSPFNKEIYVSGENRVDMFRAGPPEAKTGGVSAVQPTSATLHGTVYPNGEPTVYYFEYGATKGALTSKTGEASAGSGDSPAAVQAQLTGLSPEATYYYRLVATNRNGTSAGEEASFTLPQPEPLTGGAVEVAADAATVQGTVNPGAHASAYGTVWCFEYGTGADDYDLGFLPARAEAAAGGSEVQVSARLTGLEPDTAYHYRLAAVDDPGVGQGSGACHTAGAVEGYGADAVFTTPSVSTPPAVATGGASAVTQSSATVSGSVDPEGLATTYEFQVGVDTAYGVQVFASAGSGGEPETVTLHLGSLQPGVTYHYRLVARSLGGVSYGADATFTTGTYPSSLLTAPASPPLLATPAFAFPVAAGATPVVGKTVKAKTKGKKRKAKARKQKKSKRGRKASRARNASRQSHGQGGAGDEQSDWHTQVNPHDACRGRARCWKHGVRERPGVCGL